MSFSEIDKGLVDSLLIFYRRIEELRNTRFFTYYKNNPSKVSIHFNFQVRKLDVKENVLDDENDEFLRSFVAILRLFLLDIDNFSLRYLGENFFNSEMGLLFQLFPKESGVFNNLRTHLNNFFNSKPRINLKRGLRDKEYSFESNLEMFYNFAYGGLIHSNIDKLEKYFIFNLHINEGKNAILYPIYRNYIRHILLNIVSILDQISNQVIEKILSEILSYHINKTNGLYHKDTEKANSHYNSALYIANRTEDNQKRILLHQALEEISYILDDESLAVSHKNKAIEIERAMKGLPPDFSGYNSSLNLTQHKNSDNNNSN